MKNNTSQQVYEESSRSNFTAILLYCILVCFGFVLGYSGYKIPATSSCNQISSFPFEVQRNKHVLEVNSGLKQEPEMFNGVDNLAKKAFSCNDRAAYDELTQLYVRRTELEKHRAKGEANRDRIATINRKTIQAESSEQAFRTCLKKMVPELLIMWDDDLREGKLRFKDILANSRYDENGINLKILEETADELDSSPIVP